MSDLTRDTDRHPCGSVFHRATPAVFHKAIKRDCTPAEANSTSSRSSGSNIISQAKLPKWNWSSTTPKNSTTFSYSTGRERSSNGNSSQTKNQKQKQNWRSPKGSAANAPPCLPRSRTSSKALRHAGNPVPS
ncbi:hypothetical protein QBC32DRAFT_9792 [Pseudoneurospora amorphoporcata]|uniref:Uncharacterized protein n=1 Tax=Pseudoneurospora amorphoporcata TaxID=241081 RepID=A0AAN6P1B9_9PEZI|nr:hypothetical protein QBC32DRAFT_9792 [Pseudoneurospora amorphoporcata]